MQPYRRRRKHGVTARPPEEFVSARILVEPLFASKSLTWIGARTPRVHSYHSPWSIFEQLLRWVAVVASGGYRRAPGHGASRHRVPARSGSPGRRPGPGPASLPVAYLLPTCWTPCGRLRGFAADVGGGSPRLPCSVLDSYSVRNRPRRRSSGTSWSTISPSPSGKKSKLRLKPSAARPVKNRSMSSAICSGVPTTGAHCRCGRWTRRSRPARHVWWPGRSPSASRTGRRRSTAA